MTDRAFLARIRIEPLDRKKHDRAAFSCGERNIDNFLKFTATKQHEKDLSRVAVACLDISYSVIGYYALNAHSIIVSTLPEEVRARLPTNHDSIGAIYLSLLGVDSKFQGSGLGSHLMAHAFGRCAEIADLAGAHFIVLDALNERAVRFYRRLGFEDLPSISRRMLIAMKVVRRACNGSP